MSGGQMWGFDSIGAIATKKPHGARALQETFPSVFADTFAMMGSPQAYLPDQSGHHAPLEHGDSFQSSYHDEKKRDADRMANAKVHSTRMMNTRAFSSHNGYYGLPPPVLGQRIFANETGGVFSMNSARRDHASAPFHYSDAHGSSHQGGALLGGVLRTAEGQGFGKARLMDRIAQLNAIDANAGNFTQDPRGKISAPTQSTTSFSAVQQQGETALVSKLELFQLLQGVNDSLLGADADALTSFTYKDTTRALSLMFRLAPMLEDYELSDLQSLVSGILEKLRGAVADPDETQPKAYEIAVTLNALFDKIHKYLSEFALQTTQFGTRTDQEKLQISKTLVKTLKFASSLGTERTATESRYNPFLGETSTEAASLNRRHYDAMSEDARRSSTTSSSSSGGMDPQLRYATQDARSSARFSALAPTREDQRAEQIVRQSGLGTFDVDERGAFGNNAGHFYPTGGRDVGYVEEAIDGPPEGPFVGSPERGPVVAEISRGVGAPVVRETVPEVRGVFDEDTQQFDVEVGAEGAEGRPSFPKDKLPTTREGYDALAKYINGLPEGQRPTRDGKSIQVYASSTLPSIRKNFKRRLNLE
jgi:hypothetical protein